MTILDTGNFGNYSVEACGITFRESVTESDWLGIVEKLCAMYEGGIRVSERALMLLADSLNWGSDHFGEKHAQAIDNTRQALGLSPKTIANAQWVYKRIEPERRRDGISLGHCSVIAALDAKEQDRYMDQILAHKYTISDLKEVVASDHPKTKRGQPRKTKEDDDASVLQKLQECSHYLADHKPTEKMKFHLAALHLAYRRKWQPGKKK